MPHHQEVRGDDEGAVRQRGMGHGRCEGGDVPHHQEVRGGDEGEVRQRGMGHGRCEGGDVPHHGPRSGLR